MNAVINMLRKTVSIPDVLVSAVCGTIAAACIIPFSFMALIVFVIASFRTIRGQICSGRPRFNIGNCLASMLIFFGLVGSAAAYRPSKTEEQLLRREMTLPATQMTLAELSYVASYQDDRRIFPVRISIRFADADKGMLIKWDRQDVTLGEFLDTIESQTHLRRRFMHCGNGYTILRGGDCCFGIHMRDPNPLASSAPREQFDVDSYARNRNQP